ncbi:hypothetical protein [Tuberibacillus calidus]|jgi:hypothetical protein|uniref:hypothetical protein n=1 Tax=Tuberibacillus calidus TaxID=340097 RepID=UPI000413A54E|nr:hypothetical protein [Tuberibacillus calidus]
MASIIVENKWLILAGLEGLAWASTFFMLYARYRLNSTFWFKIGVILTVVTGVIPQVTLGVINFLATRRVDVFTVIILLLIIYGATVGKKDVKRLDRWAREKYSRS